MRLELSRAVAALVLVLGPSANLSLAQSIPEVDWRELEAPPPPALVLDKLVALDLERSQLQFGVMPTSISVGRDDVVRYVVVARSGTGAVNAMYEGIRCSSGEYKTYARFNKDTGWSPVKDALWEPMNQARQPRHALAIARSGACMGHGTVATPSEIIRNLTAPVNRRFNEPQ